MLTLTDRAAETIRILISQPGVPADTGLRMSLQDGEAGTLALALAGPQPDDAVIEDAGAWFTVSVNVCVAFGDTPLLAVIVKV